jgi:hypothetical protein
MSSDPVPSPAALIESFPRSVRAPYDQPDRTLDHLMGVATNAWRSARRADRAAALHEPITGLEISAYESRVLTHLAESADTDVVAVLNALLHRARATAPMAPACEGADDLCGAPAGIACCPGCPSLAADPTDPR